MTSKSSRSKGVAESSSQPYVAPEVEMEEEMRVSDSELKLFTSLLQDLAGFIHSMMPEEDYAYTYVTKGNADRKTSKGVKFCVAFSASDNPFRRRVLIPGIKRLLEEKYPVGATSIFLPTHKRGLHVLIALDTLAPSGTLSNWAASEGRDQWAQVNDWERKSPTYKLGLEWACSDSLPMAMRVRIEMGVLLTNLGVMGEDGAHTEGLV